MYIFVLIFEYVDDFVSINAENICQKKVFSVQKLGRSFRTMYKVNAVSY